MRAEVELRETLDEMAGSPSGDARGHVLAAMASSAAAPTSTWKTIPPARATPRYRIRAALLVVLLGSLIAIPPVRAAISNVATGVAGTFADYFTDQDSESAPGRPLEETDAPPKWLTQDGRTGQRLLASSEGYDLFVVREPSGHFGFALDNSVGLSASAASWERQLSAHEIRILGPIGDPGAAEVPLFGLTSGDVETVRVDYEAGPSDEADAQTGGFVAIIDGTRQATDLTALDADGNELEQLGLEKFDFNSE